LSFCGILDGLPLAERFFIDMRIPMMATIVWARIGKTLKRIQYGKSGVV
jgi:hypothetical protein